MSRGVWITGLVLMGLAFLLPLLMTLPFGTAQGIDGFFGAFLGLIFAIIIGIVLFLVGLIMAIVGLAAGGGQSQQQQVVIVNRPGGHVIGRVCGGCGTTVTSDHRFCTDCGAAV